MVLAYYDEPAVSFLAVQHTDPKDIPECLFIANRQTALSCSYVLDSGASVHACCHKEDFIGELRLYTGKRINGIGSYQLQLEGVGTVWIQCRNKGRMVWLQLSNVMYCPNLGVNLVSVSKLLQKGATTTFTTEKATISDGKTRFTATACHSLWTLDL